MIASIELRWVRQQLPSTRTEIGAGGELIDIENRWDALGVVNTVADPDYVTASASRERLELANEAGSLDLALGGQRGSYIRSHFSSAPRFARHVLCWSAFPLVSALGSTGSAVAGSAADCSTAGRATLFAGFAAMRSSMPFGNSDVAGNVFLSVRAQSRTPRACSLHVQGGRMLVASASVVGFNCSTPAANSWRNAAIAAPDALSVDPKKRPSMSASSISGCV